MLFATLFLVFVLLILAVVVMHTQRSSAEPDRLRDEPALADESPTIAEEAQLEGAKAMQTTVPDGSFPTKAASVPVQTISACRQHQSTVPVAGDWAGLDRTPSADSALASTPSSGVPATGAPAGDDATPSANEPVTGPRCRHGVPMQYHCELCARGATTPRERYERLYGDWTSD